MATLRPSPLAVAFSTMRTGQMLRKGVEADATTWVTRDDDGTMRAVKVADMSDNHLFRWIRYFRKKWRDKGFVGTDADLDLVISTNIVTGPAIFAEAVKRGIYIAPVAPGTGAAVSPASAIVSERPVAGVRRITLDVD